MEDAESKLKQEAAARLRTLEGIAPDLEVKLKNEGIPESISKAFYEQISHRILVLKTQQAETPYSTLDTSYQASKRLLLASIESERNTLITLRKSGEINEDIFQMLLEELDIEDMRAKTLRV